MYSIFLFLVAVIGQYCSTEMLEFHKGKADDTADWLQFWFWRIIEE